MKVSVNFKENPFFLFLLSSIILIFAFAIQPIANLNFQDKVIFSLPMKNFVWIIPMFLFSFWILYLATKKFQYSVTLTWLHVLITVITTFLIVFVLYLGITPSPNAHHRHESIGNAVQILSLILVLSQIIYLANIGIGILVRRKIIIRPTKPEP